ncbi:hypothetical protein Ait01nite_087910 [Actinoplanes italicus]|nr:hypothetical protein Ait01nite_087910 [Actinoplanes italicus]
MFRAICPADLAKLISQALELRETVDCLDATGPTSNAHGCGGDVRCRALAEEASWSVIAEQARQIGFLKTPRRTACGHFHRITELADTIIRHSRTRAAYCLITSRRGYRTVTH